MQHCASSSRNRRHIGSPFAHIEGSCLDGRAFGCAFRGDRPKPLSVAADQRQPPARLGIGARDSTTDATGGAGDQDRLRV